MLKVYVFRFSIRVYTTVGAFSASHSALIAGDAERLNPSHDARVDPCID